MSRLPKSRTVVVRGILVLVVALLAAACADDAETATDPAPTTTTSSPSISTAPTSTPPTSTPPTSTPPVEPEPGPAFAAISPIVQAFVEENDLDGAGLIVVERDAGVVYEEYWGEFSADRISLIASSSKMITAGVLLYLDDQGLLDIDAPVAEAVEWGSANPDITPAQLVSNSSGLVGLSDFGYGPYLCQFSPAGTLQTCAESVFTTPLDDDLVIPPDTQFRYGGAQWQVAGAVAEAVSGKTWSELVDEIYVQPCGLEALEYNNHFLQLGVPEFEYPDGFDGDPATLEPVDNPNMEAGAYTTTGDYAKLLLMHLRDGVCGDTEVLSPAALERLHADRVLSEYDGDAAIANPGYGMGWWVDRDTGMLSDGGAYGTVPWLDVDDGYGAYLVIEANSILGGALFDLLVDPVEAAVVG